MNRYFDSNVHIGNNHPVDTGYSPEYSYNVNLNSSTLNSQSGEFFPSGYLPSTTRYPPVQSEIRNYREGPIGANLFVYHLPQQITNDDLVTLFCSFGNIISANIIVNMETGESKGYGFVSYDSPANAEKAIHYMNGFHIENKRLKVQHKKL